jgi:hypothetical protein
MMSSAFAPSYKILQIVEHVDDVYFTADAGRNSNECQQEEYQAVRLQSLRS